MMSIREEQRSGRMTKQIRANKELELILFRAALAFMATANRDRAESIKIVVIDLY